MADKMLEKMKRQVEDEEQSKAASKAYNAESTKAKMGEGKLSLPEKVLSYPARLAILGGSALGAAGDQALYNMGVRSPSFTKSTLEGKGYDNAKKLGRMAVGIDSIDAEEGKKKGGSIKAYAKGGSIRGGGIESRGKTKGRFV